MYVTSPTMKVNYMKYSVAAENRCVHDLLYVTASTSDIKVNYNQLEYKNCILNCDIAVSINFGHKELHSCFSSYLFLKQCGLAGRSGTMLTNYKQGVFKGVFNIHTREGMCFFAFSVH